MNTRRIRALSASLVLPILLTVLPVMAAASPIAIAPSTRDAFPLVGMEIGDDFLISRAEGTVRGAPAIAYNDDLAQYLVVWVDGRENAAYWDIYGQIISSGGIPQGGNFVIRDEAAAILAYPDVAYDTVNERYLVAWYDLTEVDVEGQLLNSDGSAFGSAFNIAEGTSGDMRAYPAVAFRADQQYYLVVYQGGAAGDLNIYGKRIDASGSVGVTEYAVSTATGDQTDPDVSLDTSTNGDFLIVWEDGRTATDQIYGCLMYSTWFLGAEFAIASVADPVYNPAVAFNPAAGTAGEWLVAYQRDIGGDDQIRARRVTAAGVPAGDGFTICNDSGDQLYPDVAYNAYGNDQWLVVWEDQRAGSGHYDVYGRRVDVNGATLGDPFVVSNAPDSQTAPAVGSSSTSSGYMAVFADDYEDISGQVFTTGGIMTGPLRTLSAPLNQQQQASVAYNSTDDEFLVVWQDGRDGNWDIWGQRVALDGTFLGRNFAICSAAGTQMLPEVAYNPDTNQYLVVWEDRRTDADIYGQRVNADGSLDGGEILIAGTGSTLRQRPRVAFNPISGEYLVVYAYEVSASDHDIRARRVPPAGNPTTAEIEVAHSTADENYPDVACRSLEPGGGGYLVVWRETFGSQRDVRGERLNQNGSLLGSLDICVEASSQWSPRVAYSPHSDRYLVAWPDDRDSATQGRNVYGRQVGGGGVLHAEFAISTASADQETLAVTYGSGSMTYIIIWEDNRNLSTAPDLYGQRVSVSGELVDAQVGNNDLLYTGLGGQETPDVGWGGDEERGLLAWADGRAGSSDYHIYGRWLEAGPPYTIFLPLTRRNF